MKIKFLFSLFLILTVYCSANAQKENINEQIGFYQKYISDLRNGDCPMSPSCSDYGIKMFNEQKNSLYAMSLISERLLRCGHESHLYGKTYDMNKEMFKLIDSSIVYSKSTVSSIENNYLDLEPSMTDSAFLFTKHLINNKNYDGALLELERISFYNHNYNKVLYNKHFLYCLYHKERYEDYIYYYSKKVPDGTDYDLARLLGNSFYKLGGEDKALEEYKNAIDKIDIQNNYALDKIRFNRGFLLASKKQYKEALNEIYNITSPGIQKGEAIKVISDLQNLRYKKPWLGATLNIIPGLGYLYSNHKATAVSSFFINGLLAYATYTSFNTKNYGIAALTGIFNMSFYVGNIFGGRRSSIRYNESLFKREINKVNIY